MYNFECFRLIWTFIIINTCFLLTIANQAILSSLDYEPKSIIYSLHASNSPSHPERKESSSLRKRRDRSARQAHHIQQLELQNNSSEIINAILQINGNKLDVNIGEDGSARTSLGSKKYNVNGDADISSDKGEEPSTCENLPDVLINGLFIN